MPEETCPLRDEGECNCQYEDEYIGCTRVRATYDSSNGDNLFRLIERERDAKIKREDG